MVVGVQCFSYSIVGVCLPLGSLLLAGHLAALLLGHLTVHPATLHHAATTLALLAAHPGSVVLELITAVRAFAILGSQALFHAVQDQVSLLLCHRTGFHIPVQFFSQVVNALGFPCTAIS